MNSLDTLLDEARTAGAQGEWRIAHKAFMDAEAIRPLASDDLYQFSQASWWSGNFDETNRLFERVHRSYLDEGRLEEAASAAMELAVNHYLRGEESLGSGWAARCVRLLEGRELSPIHGYVRYIFEVEANFSNAEMSRALTAANEVLEMGRMFNDSNLIASAINAQGRTAIKQGEPARGLALLEESMAWVLAGDLTPDFAGNLYCNTVAAFHELADYRRMSEWTDALERWVSSLPVAVLFAGICRVHRAQLLRLRGNWDRAERDAARVCSDLVDISVLTVAEGWYERGEIRRLRGDANGAREAFQNAREHGRDPQPGLALLSLAEGNSDAALKSISAALMVVTEPLPRAALCAAHVEIAIAASDLDAAERSVDELNGTAEKFGSPGLQATANAANGAFALANGELDVALRVLRRACQMWRELHAPHHAARVCMLLADTYRQLGDHESAALEVESAEAIFRNLDAKPDLTAIVSLREPARPPGGLSEREAEVLGLVALGRSNRQVANELFISEKTVARHVSNIFNKLNVSSRTEAARVAVELGIGVSSRRDG